MNAEKDFIKAQIANLQLRLAEIEQKEPSKVELWEPEGGEYFVGVNGLIGTGASSSCSRGFGTEFKTESQARIAAEIMRRHNRTLCYVFEHEPDWDGSGEHYVYFESIINEWMSDDIDNLQINQHVGLIKMPKHVAEKLAADLNSGRVVL